MGTFAEKVKRSTTHNSNSPEICVGFLSMEQQAQQQEHQHQQEHQQHQEQEHGVLLHPKLRGGRAPGGHALNASRMESLAAICDTLVPSLQVEGGEIDGEEAAFYRACASDANIPHKVAALIWSYVDPQLISLVGLLLWLLSTRLGTLALCGWAGINWRRFPFVHRFSELPLANRERALQRWATGSIVQLQSLFKLFKCFCIWAFFSKADEQGRNDLVWNAIGFRAPDPSWDGLEKVEESPNSHPITPPPPLLRVHDASNAADMAELCGAGGEIECDVVVVGSGSGGGAVAAELAAQGWRVVVVEKGDYFAGSQLSLLEGPSMEAMYEGGGLFSTVDGSVNFLAGATVGGGSAVNWAAAIRTPEHVLQEWSGVHGIQVFKSPDYIEAVNRVCQRLGVSCSSQCAESFQNAVLRKGCKLLGYNIESIPRNCGGHSHACSRCGMGCKSRTKQSTAETWLADAVAAGAIVLSKCQAQRVLLEEVPVPVPATTRASKVAPEVTAKRLRARGVVASSAGCPELVIRARATVAACGSLHTPPLLQRSGLVNPNIGSNLWVHPTALVWGYFPPTPECSKLGSNIFDGPIMTSISKVVADWDKSGYGCILEVPLLSPGTFAAMAPWQSGAAHKARMVRASRTVHIIAIARDGSRQSRGGTVRQSKSGHQAPAISYNVSDADEESLKIGMEHGLRVLIAAGAAQVGTQHPDPEVLDLSSATSTADQEAFLRRVAAKGLKNVATSIASAHQMGSCRMGIEPSCSAVDSRGETWEASGLFVADASVFPTALGVNPMITVQSIALCIAKSVHSHLVQEP